MQKPPQPSSPTAAGHGRDAVDVGHPTAEPLAVALAYDQARHPAPRVVASGQGSMAQRILAVAAASGVPVRRDGDLVQVLGKLDVGETIPVEVYAVVAEILSCLYRLNGGQSAGIGQASAHAGGQSSGNSGAGR